MEQKAPEPAAELCERDCHLSLALMWVALPPCLGLLWASAGDGSLWSVRQQDQSLPSSQRVQLKAETSSKIWRSLRNITLAINILWPPERAGQGHPMLGLFPHPKRGKGGFANTRFCVWVQSQSFPTLIVLITSPGANQTNEMFLFVKPSDLLAAMESCHQHHKFAEHCQKHFQWQNLKSKILPHYLSFLITQKEHWALERQLRPLLISIANII